MEAAFFFGTHRTGTVCERDNQLSLFDAPVIVFRVVEASLEGLSFLEDRQDRPNERSHRIGISEERYMVSLSFHYLSLFLFLRRHCGDAALNN